VFVVFGSVPPHTATPLLISTIWFENRRMGYGSYVVYISFFNTGYPCTFNDIYPGCTISQDSCAIYLGIPLLKGIENFFELPSACPVLDLSLEPFLFAFSVDAPLETAVAATADYVFFAKTNDGAEVVGPIANIDDTVKVSVLLEELRKFLTLAHVGAAANLAAMLGAAGVNLAPELQEARLVPFRTVCDDFVEEVVKFLLLQDRPDENLVGVGEAQEGGLASGFDAGDATDHGRVERHGSEGIFDLFPGDAASMDLPQGLGNEIGPLSVFLCALHVAAEIRGQDFEDIAISVLIGEGPIKVEYDELALYF